MRNELWSIAFTVWNLIVFFLFGWDKLAAKKHWSRIQEGLMLLVAFLFGGVGAMFGMVLWNHKTSKMKFRLLIPLFVVLNGMVLMILPF